MPRPRNDKKAEEMYALYLRGFSLAQVGVAFGCSRQAVYKIFKLRELTLRTVEQLPFIVWEGRKFTLTDKGYYRDTANERDVLHRLVWEKHRRRKIPEGYDVHHRDEDKQNNDPKNLRLMTKSDHGGIHGFGGNQYVPSLGRRPVRSR